MEEEEEEDDVEEEEEEEKEREEEEEKEEEEEEEEKRRRLGVLFRCIATTRIHEKPDSTNVYISLPYIRRQNTVAGQVDVISQKCSTSGILFMHSI